MRRNETDKVFAAINFSGRPQAVTFKETLYHGRYTDYFGGETVELDAATRLELKPWGYKVFVK